MLRRLAITTIVLTSVLLAATEARAAVSVVLRLVDQNNTEIPGSVIQVASLGVSVGTGTSVALPEGVHTFRLARQDHPRNRA